MRGASDSEGADRWATGFQSTLPMRGAKDCHLAPQRPQHFNPRSPCGERYSRREIRGPSPPTFQSTLPMRGATALFLAVDQSTQFQSTLPMRGATVLSSAGGGGGEFQSTLPMRGATHQDGPGGGPGDFNPRSPCGERL